MKKVMALALAALMVLGCAAAFAETAPVTVESSDGNFAISFQLPEGAEMISGEWTEDGSLYQANIRAGEGLYYYLAVASPLETEEENEEETTPVTYSEENGYTDEFITNMLNETFGDAGDIDTGVRTTAYGTKLAVVRFNGEAPGAYVFTIWNGYEIGVSVAAMDSEVGEYEQITDEQVDGVTDFLSETWMKVKDAETEAPAA